MPENSLKRILGSVIIIDTSVYTISLIKYANYIFILFNIIQCFALFIVHIFLSASALRFVLWILINLLGEGTVRFDPVWYCLERDYNTTVSYSLLNF